MEPKPHGLPSYMPHRTDHKCEFCGDPQHRGHACLSPAAKERAAKKTKGKDAKAHGAKDNGAKGAGKKSKKGDGR